MKVIGFQFLINNLEINGKIWTKKKQKKNETVQKNTTRKPNIRLECLAENIWFYLWTLIRNEVRFWFRSHLRQVYSILLMYWIVESITLETPSLSLQTIISNEHLIFHRFLKLNCSYHLTILKCLTASNGSKKYRISVLPSISINSQMGFLFTRWYVLVYITLHKSGKQKHNFKHKTIFTINLQFFFGRNGHYYIQQTIDITRNITFQS